MNRLLRLTFMALLALISMSSFAEEKTVTFVAGTDIGSVGSGVGADKVVKDAITMITTNGRFGGNEYRAQRASTLSFSTSEGKITKIVMTCEDDMYNATKLGKPSVGSLTTSGYNGTWTGEADYVSFTPTNRVLMTKVEVTYVTATPVEVPAPEFSVDSVFTDSILVAITVPDGTTVYYRTDGTAPTKDDTEYTTSIKLKETTTITAAAFDANGNSSKAVTKTFVKKEAPKPVEKSVTFVAGTDRGTLTDPYTGEDQVEKDGITIKTNYGRLGDAGDYRTSKGSTFTVSSTVGNITKVVFTTTDAFYGATNFTEASDGSYAYSDDFLTGTWTGDAASFSLVAGGGRVNMSKIEVFYAGKAEPVEVKAPELPADSLFKDSMYLTITVPEGTTVYYRNDSTAPSREDHLYTAPIKLTETTIVTAAAFDADGNSSAAVTRTYTKKEIVEVQAPELPMDSVFTDSKVVTITVPEGTTVYYTTDGTVPTQESTEYTAPFSVSETMTITAVAFDKDGNASKAVSRTFKKEENKGPKGTEENPYTPSEVKALPALLDDPIYVEGIVTADVTGTSARYANYYISDDGTNTNRLEIYHGQYIGRNGAFDEQVTLKAGTKVLVVGMLGKAKSGWRLNMSYIVKIINDPTTGINNISVDPSDNTPAYNLAGQRVGKDYKGVVIKNGKKILVK